MGISHLFSTSFFKSCLAIFFVFKNELAALRISRDEAVALKTKLADRQGELELANRMIEEEIKRETKDKVRKRIKYYIIV